MAFLDTEDNIISYDHGITEMESFLNNITFDIYKRAWNKLEHKYKKQKMIDYVTIKSTEFNLSQDKQDTLILYLDKIMEKTKNNKFFKYDKEACELTTIRFLDFDDGNYVINSY